MASKTNIPDYSKLFGEGYKPAYTYTELSYINDPVFGEQKVLDGFKLLQDKNGNNMLWANDLILNPQLTEPEEPKIEQASVSFKQPDEDNGTVSNKFKSNFNINNDQKTNSNINNNQKTKALYIMDQLVNKYGRNAHEAAGIVGNLIAESKLNTEAYNGNDLGLPSGGIAQWNGSNFSKLKAYAKERGKSWKDLDLQIDFLNSTIDNDVNNRLLSSTNPLEASKAWAYYEKFAGYDGTTKSAQKLKKSKGWTEAQTQNYINKEHAKRGKYSDEIYKLYTGQS